jgi:hypothetical protein
VTAMSQEEQNANVRPGTLNFLFIFNAVSYAPVAEDEKIETPTAAAEPPSKDG